MTDSLVDKGTVDLEPGGLPELMCVVVARTKTEQRDSPCRAPGKRIV